MPNSRSGKWKNKHRLYEWLKINEPAIGYMVPTGADDDAVVDVYVDGAVLDDAFTHWNVSATHCTQDYMFTDAKVVVAFVVLFCIAVPINRIRSLDLCLTFFS